MNKGIVLLSGGMDSLVSAAIAVKECDETYFLHINYGQLTETKELEVFWKIVDFYKPKDTLVCDIGCLKTIGSSSLTDDNIHMDLHHNKEDSDQMPNTYVPFRNALMMSVAVSWAEAISANKVYIGAVEEGGGGYPDCREVFFTAFNKVIQLGTKNETSITIATPLLHLTKKEIVKIGAKMKTPFEFSWSCYQNNDKACGVCSSCRLRLEAFLQAGIEDPIEYVKR